MKIYQLILIALVLVASIACNAQQPANTANSGNTANTNNSTNAAENKPAENSAKTETKITDPKTPAETVKALSEAVRTKDYETAKKLFSKKTLEELEKNSSINQFIDQANKFYKGEPRTRNEKMSGDKATLEVENLGEEKEKWETMNFVKEEGIWKLTQSGE